MPRNLLEAQSKVPKTCFHSETKPLDSHSWTRAIASELLTQKNGAPWSNINSFPSSPISLLKREIIQHFSGITNKQYSLYRSLKSKDSNKKRIQKKKEPSLRHASTRSTTRLEDCDGDAIPCQSRRANGSGNCSDLNNWKLSSIKEIRKRNLRIKLRKPTSAADYGDLHCDGNVAHLFPNRRRNCCGCHRLHFALCLIFQ